MSSSSENFMRTMFAPSSSNMYSEQSYYNDAPAYDMDMSDSYDHVQSAETMESVKSYMGTVTVKFDQLMTSPTVQAGVVGVMFLSILGVIGLFYWYRKRKECAKISILQHPPAFMMRLLLLLLPALKLALKISGFVFYAILHVYKYLEHYKANLHVTPPASTTVVQLPSVSAPIAASATKTKIVAMKQEINVVRQ